MWAAQYYHYTKPRTFLSSGGLGTMGYGIGACIGAKTGCPDKICVNIGGDGCFRMNLIELATASRYQIPIIQIIINNHVLGMVRQWQTLFYGKRYSQTVLEDAVDYCKVAEGLGCAAIRVTAKEEVAPAIERQSHFRSRLSSTAEFLKTIRYFRWFQRVQRSARFSMGMTLQANKLT